MKKMRVTGLFVILLLTLVVRSFGADEPGFLGVRLVEPSAGQTAMMDGRAAVLIDDVMPDLPGAEAGLRSGDFLLAVDDLVAGKPAETVDMISAVGAGNTARLLLWRNGVEEERTVQLGQNPWVDSEILDRSPELHAVNVVRDITYYSGSDAVERQKLDLYLPKTDEAFPLLMWIHGGAWSLGDRSEQVALGLRFAERGVGVAMISHRLSRSDWLKEGLPTTTGVLHPEHVIDAARAFAWLHESAAEHGADVERLFVGGMSSGAHLATLLATDKRYLAQHELSPETIAGVVPVEGAYDIVSYHKYLNETGDKGDKHMHAVFGPTSAEWIDASPVTYLGKESPPMLVLTGDQPIFQAYAEPLRLAAVKVGNANIRFIHAVGRHHGTIVWMMKRREPDTYRDMIIEFVRQTS